MNCHKVIKKPQQILAINFLISFIYTLVFYLAKQSTLAALITIQTHTDLLHLKDGITFMFCCIKKTTEQFPKRANNVILSNHIAICCFY